MTPTTAKELSRALAPYVSTLPAVHRLADDLGADRSRLPPTTIGAMLEWLVLHAGADAVLAIVRDEYPEAPAPLESDAVGRRDLYRALAAQFATVSDAVAAMSRIVPRAYLHDDTIINTCWSATIEAAKLRRLGALARLVEATQ